MCSTNLFSATRKELVETDDTTSSFSFTISDSTKEVIFCCLVSVAMDWVRPRPGKVVLVTKTRKTLQN